MDEPTFHAGMLLYFSLWAVGTLLVAGGALMLMIGARILWRLI